MEKLLSPYYKTKENKLSDKDYTQKASRQAVQKTKEALESNGFSVTIVDTLYEAKDTVISMIPKGKEVFTATSETLKETGILEEIENSGNYELVRNKINLISESDVLSRRRMGSASDYTIGSVHAITESGEVLIASSSGSQLPGYVYGASNVVWVVGTQKLVTDLQEGIHRLETHSLPLEDERAMRVYKANSVISKLLIYRKDPRNRVSIVLINKHVGY